jgi:hypothetical protein
MDWKERFAKRTASMKPSAIRELLKFGNRPGMISFAGGLPAPASLLLLPSRYTLGARPPQNKRN